MRKLKLLLAACTLMGVGTASAQVEPENDGIYYMYNESSGLFLTRGGNWGTQAMAKPIGMPWKISIADGKYSLRMYDLVVAGNNNGFTADCFTDNNTPIQFTPDGDATNGFTLKNNDNYITCPATAGTISLSSTSSAWKFLTQAQYDAVLAAKVTAQEAAIATTKGITIPAGKTLNDVVTDADNWAASATVNDGVPTSANWTASKHAGRGGNLNWGDYGTEMYQCGNGHYTRTITGLKQGIYKVSVRAMKRIGSNGNCHTMGQAGYPISDSYLSANGNIIRIKAWYENCTSDSNPNNTGAFVTIANGGGYTTEGFVYVGSDGNLVVDVASEAYWGSSWFLFNGISYTFYNNEVSEEAANELIASIPTDPMLKATKDAMEDAKTTFQSSRTIPNYNALSAAIEAANQSIAVYAPLGKKLTEAATVKAGISSNSPSYTETFDTNIGTITTDYNNGSIAEADIPTQISAVESEIIKLVKSQTAEGSDMTRVLPNADGKSAVGDDNWKIENALAEGEAFHLDTWAGTASGMAVPMIEYWITNGKTLSTNKIYQTISGLQAGTYTITATIAVNNESKTAPGEGTALLFANSATKDITKGGTTTTHNGNTGTYSLSVNIAENEDLEIGIKTVDPDYNWVAFKDFKLIKGSIKPTSIVLNQTSANLMTGDAITIIATVDEDASNKTVLWESSDEDVATVANGVIFAVGAGTATITAKCEADENVKAEATITVANAAAISNWSDIADIDQGDFFIRNVATGKFLGGANDWGTRASLIKHGIPFGLTKIADGKYTLNSYTYNSGSDHFFNGTFVDQPTTDIFVTEVSDGVYALSTADGSAFVTAHAGNTIVDNTATSSDASLAQWQFLSADDMLKNLKEGDTDATFLLTEANISRNLRKTNNNSGWIGEFTYGGNNDNQCAERYHGVTNVYQTISVPNGIYKVRAQGFYRPDDGSADASYLFANNEKTALIKKEGTGDPNSMGQASNKFSADEYWNEVEVEVTDNKLTVGIMTDDKNNWTIWDNFELYLKSSGSTNNEIKNGEYFLTPDNGVSYMVLDGTAGVVSATSHLKFIFKTSDEGIATIQEPNGGYLFWDDVDNKGIWGDGEQHVKKAYFYPHWAIESADGGYKLRNIETGLYLAENSGKATCEETGSVWVFDAIVLGSEIESPLASAKSDVESHEIGFDEGEYAPYNHARLFESIDQAEGIDSEKEYPLLKLNFIKDGLLSTSWVPNSREVNAVYDGTFARAENNGAPAGWTMSNSTLGGEYHSRAFVNDERLSEFNDYSAFFMRFDGTNSDRGSQYYYGNTPGYTMPLKANTKYRVTVDFTNWGSTADKPLRLNIDGPDYNVFKDMNSTKDADKESDAPDQFNIVFTTAEAGNYVLRFQVPGSDDNKHNVVVSNFMLKKAVADDITIDEDATEAPAASDYANVTLNRGFKAGWNAVCLPMSVPAFNDCVIVELAGEEGESNAVTLKFRKVDNFVANKPYLVYFPADVAAGKTFEGIAVTPGEVKAEGTTFDFMGTYTAADVVKEGDYVIAGGKLSKANQTITLKGTRTYFTPKTAGARLVGFTVDGETTDIAILKSEEVKSEQIFDLKGVRVSKPTKGVFIQNGKKVVK